MTIFKKALSILVLGISMLLCGCQDASPPPKTAPHIDLKRYMGKWYEIASFPNSFQKGCRCTNATYTLKSDHVVVNNQCIKNGKRSQAIGKAWVTPASNNAKLKVQFVWPFKGDYWILAITPNYQVALVGSPNRKYLWILARHPRISNEEYDHMVLVAKQRGFDVSKLKKTAQDCKAAPSITKLPQ